MKEKKEVRLFCALNVCRLTLVYKYRFKQDETKNDITSRLVVVYIRSAITHYCRDECFVKSVS